MSELALNEQFLRGNTCLGCGLGNPEGLHIRIYRDSEKANRLVGTFEPRATQIGFPNIVHGGAQFTALDCMAGWVMFILRNPGRSVPLTTTATMRFRKAAVLGEPLSLSAEVVREAATPRDPVSIRCELRSRAGDLLSEADFEYVMLPEEKFKKLVNVQQLPDGYRRHFGDP